MRAKMPFGLIIGLIFSEVLLFSRVVEAGGEKSSSGDIGYYRSKNFIGASDAYTVDVYEGPDGRRYISQTRAVDKSGGYVIKLFTFPDMVATNIEFKSSEQERLGYKYLPSYYGSTKIGSHSVSLSYLRGRGFSCQGSLFLTGLVAKNNVDDDDPIQLLYFVVLDHPISLEIDKRCVYFLPENSAKQHLVSLKGKLLVVDNEIYIIDRDVGVVVKLKHDFSVENYCEKKGLYSLDMKDYTGSYDEILSSENPEPYRVKEQKMLSLLKEAKKRECEK